MYQYNLSKFIILLLIPTIAFSQGQIPIEEEFPVGKEGEDIKKVIDYINYDSSSLTNVDNTLLEQINEIKEITGNIEFKGVFRPKRTRQNQTIIIVEDENYNLWRGVFFEFHSDDKMTIKSVRLRLFPKPKTAKKTSEKEMLNLVSQKIETLSQNDLFSGTVLIAKGDEVLFKDVQGEASKRYNVKNKLDTKFNIASVGKMFTAVSIMQLVEQGKLSLDDTIQNYIDKSWLAEEIAKQVTVRHLLSHTSGLGSYFNDKFFDSSKENYITLNDFKPLIANDSLQFTPGTKHSYSNSGFILLGVIIENVTLCTYENYVNEHIYKPSGMIDSGLYKMNTPVENLAIGYIKSDSGKSTWENNLYKHVIKGGPAGGGYSTVEDLHKFIIALKHNKLISEKSKDVLWTKPSNIRTSYGLGFYVFENLLGKQIGHSGGAPGVSASVLYNVNNDYINIVLSNYEYGEQISFYLKDMIDQIEN